ncbi:hypothetical protein [Mycobacterium asiaticum]|nr:hypothetical protein [Mycobacterium asiaticum]
MWALTTSHGRRVDGISSEQDARLAVQLLGSSRVIGPYSWQVVDNRGQQFVAEVRKTR